MIDPSTQLYCIFANPVKHTKSPAIHNYNFARHHINAVYLAFEIDDIQKGLSVMRTLNIKGASITIPFKESVLDHLEGIDEDALKIGAVNTILNKNGKLFGYNTDYKAAIEPLKRFGINGKKTCIVGAGGAAQAVAYGIFKEKGRMVIVNRNKKKGQALASKYHSEFIALDEPEKLNDIRTDILINTTSVGMSPEIDCSPVPAGLLKPGMIVMDIVYNPMKTKLLTEAEKTGCNIIDGLSMFLHQGAAQFKLWTGLSPDIQLMRDAITNGDN